LQPWDAGADKEPHNLASERFKTLSANIPKTTQHFNGIGVLVRRRETISVLI
jgi:hypothetical protein